MNITGNTAQDIQDNIRTLIKEGQLQEGDFLPSVRELAEQLGVNRNTVAAAYKNLVAMGIVVSKGRLGTQVKPNQPSRILEGFQPLLQGSIDLAHGNPKRELLPSLNQINLAHFNCALYGENIYHPELLKLSQKEIFADIPQAFSTEFTYGAVDAIERILAAYLVPSDMVAVEQPGFITSICAIEHQQFRMYPLTVSEHGFDLNELHQALQANVQALIITPRSQNPTGYSLDTAQAQKIYRILEDFPHVLVIVDDHFSLLAQAQYQHIVPPSTKHWAVIRSVSKYLSPDFRFAFVCCDTETSEKLHRKLNAGSTWVSHIIQEMVYQLLSSEQFPETLQIAKFYYQQQNQKLVQYLQEVSIPCAARYDGLNVWLSLPYADKTTQILRQRGWLVRSGQDFRVNQDISAIRISTSDMTEAQMQEFCQQLRQIYEVVVNL
ncbi:aminotransferase class I/II-fold pyridoxal phosphate-dependent enzyme [Acinetobacter baumannii]|uniref:aminotransferase class I/II-fold pyridoxal phosphate-dependent enzyme n=1 Tax=Acinetobacter baumannii TaxID=470 RepID=UPI0029672FEA|nr:aminotransferase class I/II-fold pyridoxal phosphate-dependent enzyme [Acinetobacter baumannii]MDW3026377.1 aminotransferase class I/II-fold pyridoxal phosphate-dependent enzyme [Acinetobacter baumannii]